MKISGKTAGFQAVMLEKPLKKCMHNYTIQPRFFIVKKFCNCHNFMFFLCLFWEKVLYSLILREFRVKSEFQGVPDPNLEWLIWVNSAPLQKKAAIFATFTLQKRLFRWSECRDSNPRPLGPELNHTCLISYYCVQKVLILYGFYGIIVL